VKPSERFFECSGFIGCGLIDDSGFVISRWAINLMRETSHILLDGSAGDELTNKIRGAIENDADNRIVDMHVWRINATDIAAVISIVTHFPRPIAHYRNLLDDLPALKHITIEVNICEVEPCPALKTASQAD
jgi:Co/Zn/Cd efflux system component